MTVQIPQAGGVPGINGPPNWFSSVNGGFSLEDVRWNGAVQRTFAGGASPNGVFRAVQAVEGSQQYIYLSFRAAWVDGITDEFDYVFVGIQRHGTTSAMVIQIQAHPAGTVGAGLPSPNPPGPIGAAGGGLVQVYLRPANPGDAWLLQPGFPSWISTNTRYWLSSASDPTGDGHNRWAVQMRIPANTVGDILGGSAGPNLGTDFDMWYFIRASTSLSHVVLLADSRLDFATTPTTNGQLTDGTFPFPIAPPTVPPAVPIWDEYQLSSGPGANGGVTIHGNGSNDIAVWNMANGEGTTIQNDAQNIFIARPRNYRAAGQIIPAAAINASFRIANWGSVSGNTDFTSGTWNFLGNTGVTPVPSIADIPVLTAPNDPVPAATAATEPLNLVIPNMPLAPGLSQHQCILVTLSGTNLNFLCNSAFKNMNFAHASVLDREAEINIVGLKAFSAQPRDVYLALEKINMARDTPGTDEGKFLEASRKRLIAKGGPLADKLKKVSGALSDVGDAGSGARLRELLDHLQNGLLGGDGEGNSEPQALVSSLGRWLTEVKKDDANAKRLVPVFEKLAAYLEASDNNAPAKVADFIAQLSQWALGLNNDPASMQLLPPALRLWASYLGVGNGGSAFGDVISQFFQWASGNRDPKQFTALIDALRRSLSSPPSARLKALVANFAHGVANWLKGAERLETLVEALSAANLTEDEVDQLFPTFRVHVYHDTGERVIGKDGKQHEVLRAQSSFGIYAYHEGSLEGWQTSIQGARRLTDRLYVLPVPNDGMAKIRTVIQAVEKNDQRIPDDPIRPRDDDKTPPPKGDGCLSLIKNLFGKKK